MVSNPTRPTRPPKEPSQGASLRQGKSEAAGKRPNFEYLPPPGTSKSEEGSSKLSFSRGRQPKKAPATSFGSSNVNKFQRMDQESSGNIVDARLHLSFDALQEAAFDVGVSQVKPRASQENSGVYYPVFEPFRPHEAIPPSRKVRQFLSGEGAGDKNILDSISGPKNQSMIDSSNNSEIGYTISNQEAPTLQTDSLVVYNTSPPPPTAVPVYNQPPRPDHPPPPRAARLDNWVPTQPAVPFVGPHSAPVPQPPPQKPPPKRQPGLVQGAPKPDASNPFAFLLPRGVQEDWKRRKYPRIEVRFLPFSFINK